VSYVLIGRVANSLVHAPHTAAHDDLMSSMKTIASRPYAEWSVCSRIGIFSNL